MKKISTLLLILSVFGILLNNCSAKKEEDNSALLLLLLANSRSSTSTSSTNSCSSASSLTYASSSSGSVSSSSYQYYKYTASTSGTYYVTLTASTGDPDLYMNVDSTTCPTKTNYTYSSSNAGSEYKSVYLYSGETLNIGVYGFSSSSYSISISR
ncbi:MAG: hypothetical protein L6Q54_13485 [Leptospiraceae bacterium]|nr:hypothetical protein [Leptospiraceae bacterium]